MKYHISLDRETSRKLTELLPHGTRALVTTKLLEALVDTLEEHGPAILGFLIQDKLTIIPKGYKEYDERQDRRPGSRLEEHE